MKTKHRLRRPAEFEAVRAERKDAGDYLLRVQVRPNALGHPRFGVVVTRRQGGSVVRNRLRRRLQAAARSRLCSTAAYDIVLTPRRAAQAVEFEALCASLAQALEFTGAAR
ncbi:MAG TPA: ribonuclease P protein component [Candidatus Micrarchaeaceae archaeon]|nr:ribonuclease P protein component [Candidatus Micrarchaeaceae archaeon]